jgi:hypothetical protein
MSPGMRAESQPSSMCVVLVWYVIVLVAPQVKRMSVYQEQGLWCVFTGLVSCFSGVDPTRPERSVVTRLPVDDGG